MGCRESKNRVEQPSSRNQTQQGTYLRASSTGPHGKPSSSGAKQKKETKIAPHYVPQTLTEEERQHRLQLQLEAAEKREAEEAKRGGLTDKQVLKMQENRKNIRAAHVEGGLMDPRLYD